MWQRSGSDSTHPPRPARGRDRGPLVQPTAGRGERRAGARQHPRRPPDVRRRGRRPHFPPGGGVRRVRRSGTAAGTGARSAPAHLRRPPVRRGRVVRPQPGGRRPGLPGVVAPGAGRDGDGQRRAAVAGEAPLPHQGRDDDGGIHDVDGCRPHLRLGAHRAAERRARRMGVRADGLVADRGRRRGAVGGAAARGPRLRARRAAGVTDRDGPGGADPPRLDDGAVLRHAVLAGLRDLRLVRRGLPRRWVLQQ